MGLNNQFAYDTRGDVNLESSDSESFITAEPKRKRLKKIAKHKTNHIQVQSVVTLTPETKSENWTPLGRAVTGSIYFDNAVKTPTALPCYSAVLHRRLNIRISTRDCVLIRSEEISRPFVGKIIRIFQDVDGELKINLLWYYRVADIRYGQRFATGNKRELLASRHLAVTSADCIEGVAHVLTFSQFNRFMASRKAKLQGLSIRAERTLIPFKNRLIYPDPDDISAVFFCRRSHHIRNLSTNGSQ